MEFFMVKIHKVYTKNGDLGQTYLANGQITEKSNERIEVLACLDSLMLELGSTSFMITAEKQLGQKIGQHMLSLLNRLFDQGAVIALTPKSTELVPSESEIVLLETWIDDLNQGLAPLINFVLPQGNLLLTQVHRTRVQCRILEQKLWNLNQTEPLDLNLLKFFNRLSDYFFVTSRYVTKVLNLPEPVWQTGHKLN